MAKNLDDLRGERPGDRDAIEAHKARLLREAENERVAEAIAEGIRDFDAAAHLHCLGVSEAVVGRPDGTAEIIDISEANEP